MFSTELPLPKDRELYLTKQVNQDSMGELTRKILEINKSDKYNKQFYKLHGLKYKRQPIKIYIDSYGGQVYQCFGLLSVMEQSKTPIHTIVTGCAMSCGFMILISGHKRYAYNLSTPLYHQVSSAMYGKLKDLEEDVMETKRLQALIEEITLKKTRITPERLKEVFEKKIDWFMDAKQALELGVVDEII